MIGISLGAVVAPSLVGSVTTPVLVRHGLAQLGRPDAGSGGLGLASVLGGGAAGAAATAASHRTEIWWLAPALLIWGCTLAAAACCDAASQRIPTPLVRCGSVLTCVFLVIGLAVAGDWSGLVLSGIAAAAAGLTMLLCWRFAGAGFGDVRLATLGGLGLGHATHRGLVVAFAAFTLITMMQAVIVLARGGNRRTTFAYGPGLTVGFLLAAAV